MWLLALKILGAVSGAAFGAPGVGATTRNKTGRLTPHGKIAFSGIAVSLAISLATMIIENRVANAAALAQSSASVGAATYSAGIVEELEPAR